MSARHDWTRCHLCGSAEIRADSPMGSPTCDECWPITDHVVSMRTGPGGSALAVCPCGWRAETMGQGRNHLIQVKVRLHWREVIRRKAAEFDAVFGAGSAADEAVNFTCLAIFLVNAVAGVLLFVDQISGVRP